MSDAPAERGAAGWWGALRRRKVVQWGIIYVAAAWGFLQGLEYVSESFHWPDKLRQIALIALLIGLPIVLVVAWYQGDRGERRVSTVEFAILTLLLVLGGGAFWYFQRASETLTVASPPPPSAAALATDASIAVLPFVNMSSDKEQEYFADGISEELLNLLAQVPELRVIARTSSFSFKGKNVEIAEIARRLNVANVLEGSVRRSGEKIRITAQLVRASDSSHLWSQTYDRQMTDVLKVQDDIAASVVDELRIKLLRDAPKARATDPQAYELFLKARAIGSQFTAVALDQAVALYQQALARDPGHTESWVGLADIYCTQVNNNLRSPDEGIRLAREATEKALALDPKYAPAYASLGWIAIYYDRDFQQAANRLTHALTLDPTNTEAISTAAILFRRLGRWDQAIALGEYLVRRDPVSEDTASQLGFAYQYAGRWDEALARHRTALALNPESIGNHARISVVLLAKGDAEAALAEARQEPDIAERLTVISPASYALGHAAESDAALAELIRGYAQSHPLHVATVLAFRGEADRAFEWMAKAAEQHDPSLGAVIGDPMFDKLRDDPRWLAFLSDNSIAPDQLAAIEFDVKVPK